MFAVCLKRDSKSIFFATTTTIHIFGLIKVTATITPVDSESKNYVYDKVQTRGSSIQALQLLKFLVCNHVPRRPCWGSIQ